MLVTEVEPLVVLHLVAQQLERDRALAFELIVAERVFVHHDDLEGVFAVQNVEGEGLVPDWRQRALLVVRLDLLVFNL